MSKLFDPIALGTNLYKGYSLEEALGCVRGAGFEYAELSSIAGMCEHVAPDDINDEFAEKVKALLGKYGLKTYAFAGHVDLTEENDLRDFLKKLDFASAIGVKIVNTNSGPLSRLSEFRSNMKRVIERAERRGVMVGLESHGDIIGTAKDSVRYIKEINHPLIRMNYDTGNTYFHANGNVTVQEDILYSLEYLAHIHLKDVAIRGREAYYCPIGQGDLDFKAIFKAIGQLGTPIPASLEIPVFVAGTLGALSSANAPYPIDKAKLAAEQSMAHINGLLENIGAAG